MFYITISNGLLKDGHRKRIGSAVWEFMWLIDRITKIDEKGDGWVLGGKPINLQEMADGVDDDTVSRNLSKLEEEGYINKIRTPYGISIRVKKAKKTFGNNAVSNRNRKNAESHRENAVSNKTIQLDNTDIHITTKEDLPDWIDKNVWKEWEEHRKDKKQKLTPRSIALQIKLLSDHKDDYKEIIETSIRNNWTGLFPLKNNTKKKMYVA